MKIAGVALIVYIFYLGATWGPGPVDADWKSSADTADRSLVEESVRLMQQFETRVGSGQPSEADLDLLRQALDKQRAFNLSRPPSLDDRRRQDDLEKRLAHFEAKAIHDRSLAAERDAQRLLAEGQPVEAIAKIQEALDLQKRVNQDYGRTSSRDAAREGRLYQQLASIEAEPLHARSIELEGQGDKAAENSQWADARNLYSQARDFQQRINELARRSSYFSTARYQSLNDKIAALAVGERMSESLDLQARAEQHEKNGAWEQAAQLYEEAMVLQNQINRNHAQSRFVSTERVAELDAARQSALAAPQAQELDQILGQMRSALAKGDFAAARDRLAQASPIAARIAERFPKSRYASFDLRLELDYLDLVQESLPELQTLLRDSLRPIPGSDEWQMSSTLVSQKVFSRVMNANPSRNRGEELPVDSVSLEQASQFCQRASWILARPVRLPRRSEFQAALGEWDPKANESSTWHKENSDGKSHPVNTGAPNTHGFFHLIGNLRSWLGETTEDGSAWVAGVSFAEDLPEGNLFRLIERNRREETIGFRYVVGPN